MDVTELHPFVVLFAAITTDNILLTRFLGMCPFLAVSKSLKSAFGLGAAVVFVLTCTTVLNWLLYHHVLIPYDLAYLQYVAFIIVIAAFVQIVEMAVERLSTPLYMSLGIFLPLITVNCAILGGSLFMVSRKYTLLQSAGFGFGSGLGWMLAILAMAGIREKMQKKAKVIPQLEGPGIALIIAGTMALAFMGFSGVLRIS
ncbi:MAG: Rnf-Nqr domain containing protein [Planctomycetota bacterium]|jgi:Na+-transporting NADH:ubiquinone oxidoreductase subunit E